MKCQCGETKGTHFEPSVNDWWCEKCSKGQ